MAEAYEHADKLVCWLEFDALTSTLKGSGNLTATIDTSRGELSTEHAFRGNALKVTKDSTAPVSVGNIAWTYSDRPMTFDGWAYISSATASGTIFSFSYSTQYYMELTLRNGALTATIRSGSSDTSKTSMTADCPIARLFHFEFVYSADRLMTLYIDGVQVAKSTKSQVFRGLNYPVSVGAGLVGCTLDEIRYFKQIALHEEDFTPPTAEDYDKLDFALKGINLNVRSQGKNLSFPMKATGTRPALAVRYNGITLYNPLVATDAENAGAIRIQHNGTAYALST